MKNDVSIEINSTINVNRVQNSVIVFSFLINVFFIGLFIYLFTRESVNARNFRRKCEEFASQLENWINETLPRGTFDIMQGKEGWDIDTLSSKFNCNLDEATKYIKKNVRYPKP